MVNNLIKTSKLSDKSTILYATRLARFIKWLLKNRPHTITKEHKTEFQQYNNSELRDCIKKTIFTIASKKKVKIDVPPIDFKKLTSKDFIDYVKTITRPDGAVTRSAFVHLCLACGVTMNASMESDISAFFAALREDVCDGSSSSEEICEIDEDCTKSNDGDDTLKFLARPPKRARCESSTTTKKHEQENYALKALRQDALDTQERGGSGTEALAKELVAANERCACYKSTIDSLEKSMTEVQSQAENRKAQCDEEVARSAQIMELKQEAETQCRLANSVIDQLKESIEKKSATVKQISAKHEDAEEERAKEKEQFSNEIVLLRDQMEDAQQSARQKECLADEVQQEKDALLDQLRESHDEREKMQQELLKLKTQVLASDEGTTSDSPGISLANDGIAENVTDFPENFRVQFAWPFLGNEFEPVSGRSVQGEEDLARLIACRCMNARGAIAHGKPTGLAFVTTDFPEVAVESIFQARANGFRMLSTVEEIKLELMTRGPVVSTSFRLRKGFADSKENHSNSSFLLSRIDDTHPLLIIGWKFTKYGDSWITNCLDYNLEPMIAFGHFDIDKRCIAPIRTFEHDLWQEGPYFRFDFSNNPIWRDNESVTMLMSPSRFNSLFACFDNVGLYEVITEKKPFELCDQTKIAHSRKCVLKDLKLDSNANLWKVFAEFTD